MSHLQVHLAVCYHYLAPALTLRMSCTPLAPPVNPKVLWSLIEALCVWRSTMDSQKFRSDDRVAFITNPAFDPSTYEVWALVTQWALHHHLDQRYPLDPPTAGRCARRHQVTLLYMTTCPLHQYAFIIGAALSKLKYLLGGAEQGLIEAYAEVAKHGGPVCVVNTVWSHRGERDSHGIQDNKCNQPITSPPDRTASIQYLRHMSWTSISLRYLSVLSASFTLAEQVSRMDTSTDLSSQLSDFFQIRLPKHKARACTRLVIWRATCLMETWYSWAATTTKSRSVGIEWNLVRSKHALLNTLKCVRLWYSLLARSATTNDW